MNIPSVSEAMNVSNLEANSNRLQDHIRRRVAPTSGLQLIAVWGSLLPSKPAYPLERPATPASLTWLVCHLDTLHKYAYTVERMYVLS